ncbi:MAG: hypothetical protein KGO82_17020 [Bacteroidota bacterium]|nr:hypothetical protein [Bacteroidota bacterium]
MIKYFTTLCIIGCSLTGRSQFLTQQADGKGTIPLPLNGLGLSVDPGKTDVSLGVNNYAAVINKDKHFLMGANLSVKSSSGLGSLFKSGDIVPDGNLLAFAGYHHSNEGKLLRDFSKSDYQQLKDAYYQELRERSLALRQSVKSGGRMAGLLIEDKELRSKTLQQLEINLDTLDANKVIPYLKSYKAEGAPKAFLDAFTVSFTKDIDVYKEQVKQVKELYLKNLQEKYDAFREKRVPIHFAVFAMGGINARSFTRYLGTNATALAKSFQDTLFRGGNFGIGMNLQVRNFWLGLTYTYVAGDNFSDLSSKAYTLRTTDTNSNQTLISEKAITAYGGKYAKVENNLLNIDLAGEFRLGDTSRLLIDLYCRANLFSRDTSYLRNTTNLGAGFYFIGRTKFIGGLYVELPDINNNIQKTKPLSEQSLRSPLQRLSFGIVTKFNLSSLFNWSGPAPKVDG